MVVDSEYAYSKGSCSTTINLPSLPPDTAQFVAGIVSSGRFASVDEVVVAALRAYQDREHALATCQRQIDEGRNDFACGDYVEITDEARHRALFDSLKADVFKASRGNVDLP